MRNILDNLAVFVGFFTPDGTILEVNRLSLERAGISREDVIGKKFAETYWWNYAPDVQAQIRDTLRRAEKGEIVSGEFRPRMANDVIINIFAIFAPLRDESGTVVEVVGSGFDITDRKRAEAALRESADQFRQLTETIRDVFWIATPDNRLLYVSPAYEEIWGRTPESLMANPTAWLKAVEAQDRPRVLTALERLAQGGPYDLEYRIRRPDGSSRWVHDRGFAIRDADGTISRKVGAAGDITDRKRAEAELRESEERYRILFDLGPVPKILWDPETFRILEVNRAAIAHYGYSKEEFQTMTIRDFSAPEDVDDRDARSRPVKSTDGSGRIRRHVRKDGSVLFVDVTGMDLTVHGRRLSLGYFHDVTEQRLAEKRLRRSLGELTALSARLRSAREEECTRIAREVHDELGQLLTAAKLDTERLRKKLQLARPLSRRETAKGFGSIVALLDNAVDAVHRISTQLRPGMLDDLGLEPAIEWWLGEFQARTEISCALRSGMGAESIDRDRSTALFRIFQEALTNVSRHAAAKAVEIKLSKTNGRIVLKITDDGVGIADLRITDSKSLGLIGMRERARALGGDVSVRRADGGGTVVEAVLPL